MENNQLISKELNDSFDQTIALIQDLSDIQVNRKPDEHSWSIGQVVEHILICSTGIPDRSTEPTDRAFDELVPAINGIFLDFSTKFDADPALQPRKDAYIAEDLIQQLKDRKTKLILKIKDKNLRLLCKDTEFPQLGYLTGFEWLTVISSHTKRHNSQIERTKALLEGIGEQ